MGICNRPLFNITRLMQQLMETRNFVGGGVSKVVIFSYTRGGSTLCCDIFNIDRRQTLIWYEALHGFHSRYSGLTEESRLLPLLYHQNMSKK